MFRGAAAGVARTAGWCVTPDSSRTCAGVCAATRGAKSLFIILFSRLSYVTYRPSTAELSHHRDAADGTSPITEIALVHLISKVLALWRFPARANSRSAVSSVSPSASAAARCNASKVRSELSIEATNRRALMKCSVLGSRYSRVPAGRRGSPGTRESGE
jgi:hypothetical protein